MSIDRQPNAGRGFDTIVRTLNRDGITPFACLEGVFPATKGLLSKHYLDYRLDLSLPKLNSVDLLLASYNVIRGPALNSEPAAVSILARPDISTPYYEG